VHKLGRRLPPLAAVSLLVAACGSASTVTKTVTVTSGAAAQPAVQEQLQTLATVAERIYSQESKGSVDQSPIRKLLRNPALTQAIRSGDAAAASREADIIVTGSAHTTGIRVLKGGREFINVAGKTKTGGSFLVGGKTRPLRSVPGVKVQISIQDILGYVSLVHRVTGTEVVVRGSAGHALASLPAATHAKLPRSGRARLAGRTYRAISFGEPGWSGERLTVWLLQPV
jgi:hypothetical protein